jgi:hypothetical protein
MADVSDEMREMVEAVVSFRTCTPRDVAVLLSRIARLEQTRDALGGLASFARHHPGCTHFDRPFCSCGYTEAREFADRARLSVEEPSNG